jgi:flagellar hook-associated protein 3 FlgL
MRVTNNSRLLSMMRNNAATAERLTKASRLASSGARVVAPSDDPVAYAKSVRLGSELATLTSRMGTARSAADELTISERALDSATDLLGEAKSLAVQGANGSLSATDRNALAQSVDGLREQLLQLSNTRGSQGFVFAGSATLTAPFNAGGVFVGNDAVLRVPITDGVTPRMNASGAKAFTVAGGRDVFADLAALSTALKANDLPGIQTAMDTIQAGYDQVVAVQVEAGLSIERLRSSADVMESASLAMAQSRARDIGGDDFAGLATELAEASNAYEQSLSVTRRLLTLPSLANG